MRAAPRKTCCRSGWPGSAHARQPLVHRIEVEEEVVLDGDVGGGALALVVDARDGEEAVGLVGERERARRPGGQSASPFRTCTRAAT